jgi:hypothetical protein
MPRKARVDAPGVLLHIVVQGIENKQSSRTPQTAIFRAAIRSFAGKSYALLCVGLDEQPPASYHRAGSNCNDHAQGLDRLCGEASTEGIIGTYFFFKAAINRYAAPPTT